MRRTSLAAAAVTGTLILTPVAAFAAWTGSGSGTGTATATTVNRATAPSATRGTGSVALSWSAVTLANSSPVAGYDVYRHDGSTLTKVCDYVTDRSCTDTAPVAGAVTYGVVARIGANWQGAESPTTGFTYDTFAPTTTMTTSPSAPNAAGWFNKNVTVTLTATDSGSPAAGVKEIHYTLNGTETVVQSATASVTVTQEQLNQLTFWAVDNNGNTQSPVNAAVVQLDKTAPVSTISPAGSTSWITTNQVTLSASDATSGVASVIDKVDDNSATTYSGPFTLTDGSHTVTYHAVDVAGNVEADKNASIKVDTTKPIATVDPLSGTTNSVTIRGSDATSGVARVEYQLDSSTTWTTGAAVSWAAGTGSHTLRYRVVDVAGNVGDVATATYTATAVAVPPPAAPVITGCSLGNGNSTPTTITWTETADPTNFEVHYLDSASTQTFEGTARNGALAAASNNTSGEFWLVAIGPGGSSAASNHYTYAGNGSNRGCNPK